jgi:hypothetical protein
MTEKICKILKICAEKHIEFNYMKEGSTNFMSINPKLVIINIGDPEDINFENELDKILQQLGH